MMLDINLTKENTHIGNSYIIKTKKSMENEIEYIKLRREARRYPVTRTTNSYVREWKGHNNLYNLHLFRKHTASVDLNENNSIIEEIIWLIIGGI